MKILLATTAMNQITGSPMYFYELAMQLARDGHDVHLASWFFVPDEAAKPIKENLESAGVKLHQTFRFDDVKVSNPDLAFVSQQATMEVISATKPLKVVNIIHSEYENEMPMPPSIIDRYVAIRPSIKQKLADTYMIPEHNISVIYNGIDAFRFNPRNKVETKRPYQVTLVPCTFDPLRANFLDHMTSLATEKNKVVFVGQPAGHKLKTNKFTEVYPPTWNIDKFMAQSDRVAGILLGRVNLEAAFMGLPSDMYDPETLDVTEFPAGYDKRYDIKTVASQLTSL